MLAHVGPRTHIHRKLKQAYKLSARDEETLVALLAERNCIDLYYSWREAELYFLKIEHPGARNIDTRYFPDVADLGNDLLQERHATKRMLLYFMNHARNKGPRELLQKIFERVAQATYDDTDESYLYVAESILNLIYKERYAPGGGGSRRVALFCMPFSANSELFKNFCNFFDDAIIVDKLTAVRHLSSCGYSLQQEVKGLSHALVESITAEGSALSVQDEASKTPNPSVIFVPRALWEGKSLKSVYDSMRQQHFADPVIFHVLHYWCGEKNMTRLGRLLGPGGQDPSTDLRRARRLLEAAKTMNIQHA